MKVPRKTVIATVSALLFGCLIAGASAYTDQSSGKRTAATPKGSQVSHHVVRFTTPGPLHDAVSRTMRGDKGKDGCVWHPPELTLAPNQQAIEARQVSADLTACTTVVEIGTPAVVDPIPSGETVSAQSSSTGLHSGPSTLAGGRSAQNVKAPYARSAYTTSQAYFKVTWWDPVGIDVNHVRSILNWTWGNNGCIIGSIASSAVYAQSGTGWSNSNWSWWKDTSCTSHYTRTNADFQNPYFCTATTYTHYSNVWIRGGYQGGYGGNLDSTSATGGCTYLLHWSQELVKEY